ncbi:glycosyltransferase [Arenibacter sp. GZD96]|uniref:glycosyltransferase n=1 Tax=Aurantibrevibacter litoralis TaxID=3106030 RepID=UPI002AFE5A51|nr:glycosyltransferase [Arenibacter sp. GZD-96]MEA1785328.1 glycosyltransferase [Arenibacter sp. GZD-96]
MIPQNVLFIGLSWPEPTATAAGIRIMHLIQFFIAQKCKITFASTATVTTDAHVLLMKDVVTASITLNHDSFDDFVRNLNPDIVIFDRFYTEEQFGWRIAEQVPDALRILDTEDLHSLRAAREHCVKVGIPFTPLVWVQNETTKREIASVYRCDLSLIISSFEMKLLTTELKIDKNLLFYLPFLVENLTKKEKAQWPSYEERNNFVFIGTGKHAPNIDAIKWLKHDIWPAIRRLMPSAQLKIYGSYFPEFIMQMHQPKDGFYVLGWAKEAKTVISEARVCLAPLRFGAGLKGKLVDAMQYGTPSVTTPIGAEGINDTLPWGGFVQNDAVEFAEAAVQLYHDEALWLQAQTKGVHILAERFNRIDHLKRLQDILSLKQKKLEVHRAANFTGALLQHQTMAATKYMSRWIQLKNAIN